MAAIEDSGTTHRMRRGLPVEGSAARAALVAGVLACSCADPQGQAGPGETRQGASSSTRSSVAADVPVPGIGAEWSAEFNRGDVLFDLVLREGDGLGPLYTRQACSSCHAGALRGSGFVQKMSILDPDGVTPAADQSALIWGHTVHPFVAGGATTPVLPPNDATVRVSTRLGPPVLGRGYLEAVSDEAILATAALQANADDGVRGRVNYVTYASQANDDRRFHDYAPGDTVIGRFGVKARIATLDDFTADALLGDMGITNPLRPEEVPNPDHLVDDGKPGIDATLEDVNQRANYTRLLAIPPRSFSAGNGRALFVEVGCAACHVPSLRTRADYPIEPLADIDAPIYADLLLHDMGDELADGLAETDGQARSRDWRTAPLIGLRYLTTYLHDGRAKTLRDAISMHDGSGSEAHASIVRFDALSEGDQRSLLDFVGAL